MPTKKLPAQAGRLGSSIITLKRASRSPAQIANTIAAIQPALPSSCSPQKYRISAGATPKLTKSARLSSSAPNFDVPLSMRATRPSMPSSIAANTMAATAHSSLCSKASRMAVNPAQSASSVMRFGTSIRTGIGRKRRRFTRSGSDSRGLKTMPGNIVQALSRCHDCGPALLTNYNEYLADAKGGFTDAAVQVRDYGFAGDRGLPRGHQRPRAFRQIDVHARAEADHADALARTDGCALAREAYDSACQSARVLRYANRCSPRRDN